MTPSPSQQINWRHVQDLLEAHFGPGYFNGFEHYMADDSRVHEWRFMGSLGFGGKITQNGGRLWVSCYSEHETPERRQAIDKVNAELKETIS